MEAGVCGEFVGQMAVQAGRGVFLEGEVDRHTDSALAPTNPVGSWTPASWADQEPFNRRYRTLGCPRAAGSDEVRSLALRPADKTMPGGWQSIATADPFSVRLAPGAAATPNGTRGWESR